MAFSKRQPKAGDTIMHCGHLIGSMHWFEYDRPLRFQRPDGTKGAASWFAACDPCFIKRGEKVTNYVRGDGIWRGDAPVIEKEEA